MKFKFNLICIFICLVLGGFDGTSNVLAGKLFNIPVKGTHAHAYITSFSGFDELTNKELPHNHSGILKHLNHQEGQLFIFFFFFSSLLSKLNATGITADLLELSMEHRKNLSDVLHISTAESNDGELAAMVSFAIAFPNGFMALVDTYDVKRYIICFFLLSK